MKIELILLFTSVSCNFIQIITWWNTSQRKKFAAENDFLIIKHSLETLSKGQQNIEHLIDIHEEAAYRRAKETESIIINELKDLKGVNNALIVKLTGDTISNVLNKTSKNL